jgi:hypothetical protein
MSTPSVLGDGLFCWQLPPGDYLLIGSPMMTRPHRGRATPPPLAALRVVPGPEISAWAILRSRP